MLRDVNMLDDDAPPALDPIDYMLSPLAAIEEPESENFIKFNAKGTKLTKKQLISIVDHLGELHEDSKDGLVSQIKDLSDNNPQLLTAINSGYFTGNKKVDAKQMRNILGQFQRMEYSD